jgi:malonyl-CoA O-methyltransferase
VTLNERIRDAFDAAAPRYDRHAALESEVASRLLDRIAFRRDEPRMVLDLGCGTGGGAEALKQSFRKAQVVALDLSPGMLAAARGRSRLTRPLHAVQADMAGLPFARASVDLAFCNLALPFLADPVRFFGEALRVLRPGGMLLFSAFGPGSLDQLDTAAAAAGYAVEASGFPDLLELGDALTATGFREPVMDVDRVTLDYPGVAALLDELEVTGTALLVDGWSRLGADPVGLESHWPGRTPDGRVPLTFEIVYGAAFGSPEGQPRRTENGEEATFSVDSLLKSRRGSSI